MAENAQVPSTRHGPVFQNACNFCSGSGHEAGLCCTQLSMPSVDSGLEVASSQIVSPYGSPNNRNNQKPSPCASPVSVSTMGGVHSHSSPLPRIRVSSPGIVASSGSPIVTSTPAQPRRTMQSSTMPTFSSTGGMESKTNLIVNYLPQNYTQDNLRELFSSIGDIETCKLCRNRDTKLSLGYGFVNFRRAGDAKRAVSQFNGLSLQNKTIKVSFARPSSNIIKNTNLYVAGIPRSATLQEVKNLFSRIGKIISARILHCKDTGLSKGVAFVRFDTRLEAERAVKLMHQYNYEGETLTVKIVDRKTLNRAAYEFGPDIFFASPMEKAEKGIQSNLNENGNVSMKGNSNQQPADLNFQQFQENFQARVFQSLRLLRNGFHSLNERLSPPRKSPPQKMILGYSPHYPPHTPPRRDPLSGRTSSTSEDSRSPEASTSSPPAAYSSRRRSAVPVFISVSNLPPDVTESKVWELFGPFGAVNSISITRRESESSNPVKKIVTGTVQMPVYQDALGAICALQGTELSKGYKLRLEFQLPAMGCSKAN